MTWTETKWKELPRKTKTEGRWRPEISSKFSSLFSLFLRLLFIIFIKIVILVDRLTSFFYPLLMDFLLFDSTHMAYSKSEALSSNSQLFHPVWSISTLQSFRSGNSRLYLICSHKSKTKSSRLSRVWVSMVLWQMPRKITQTLFVSFHLTVCSLAKPLSYCFFIPHPMSISLFGGSSLTLSAGMNQIGLSPGFKAIMSYPNVRSVSMALSTSIKSQTGQFYWQNNHSWSACHLEEP